MLMPVTVGLTYRVVRVVQVPVMLVMPVEMIMCQRLVKVLMFVVLGQMKPNAYRHQDA